MHGRAVPRWGAASYAGAVLVLFRAAVKVRDYRVGVGGKTTFSFG